MISQGYEIEDNILNKIQCFVELKEKNLGTYAVYTNLKIMAMIKYRKFADYQWCVARL